MYKVNSTSYDNVDVVAATMLAMLEVAIAEGRCCWKASDFYKSLAQTPKFDITAGCR